jgi:hypothetical protein
MILTGAPCGIGMVLLRKSTKMVDFLAKNMFHDQRVNECIHEIP